MNITILNSFAGDKKKKIDTETEAGKQETAKLIEELLRSGSVIFLERTEDGKTKTYRVSGYHPETDRIVIKLHAEEKPPVEAQLELPKRRGHYRKYNVPAGEGKVTSAAPSAGGCRGFLG